MASRQERTVRKKDKDKDRKRPVVREEMPARSSLDSHGAMDWSALYEAAERALIWAHELARETCKPGERTAIERTFRSLYALLDGRATDGAPLDDMLTTVRVVGRAVERDLGLWRGSFDLLAELLGLAFAEKASAPPPAPWLGPWLAPLSAIRFVGGIHPNH
jgi:hypothetical protein